MTTNTPGESWIKLLCAYGPVPGSRAQEAEHVERVAKRLEVAPLSFVHPKEEELQGYFAKSGRKKVAVITGTAGDGKTTMCLRLINKLSGKQAAPEKSGGVECFQCLSEYGDESITILYDVTGWRKKDEDQFLTKECVDVLELAAQYAKGDEGEAMLMAVNDGQLHEINKALPESCSQTLKDFFAELLGIHSQGLSTCPQFPDSVLINLSSVQSDELMRRCLECILDRDEWKYLDDEASQDPSKLFGPNCSIKRNYETIKSEPVRKRLEQLAIIADSSGYHLPVRSIIILIVNALLGNPAFKTRLIKPGVDVARNYNEHTRYKAAFHLNFFGLNMGDQARKSKTHYQFLEKLRIGLETINDIDELLIFGSKQPKLKNDYNEIVDRDPHAHQDPGFKENIQKYLLGEVETDIEISEFRRQLGNERKRLFFSSAEDQHYNFWLSSVLHYAREYIEEFFKPARNKEQIHHANIVKIAAGLNRVWTGLLVKSDLHELHLTTGLDLTTAPISDILIQSLDIEDIPREGIEVKCGGHDKRLQLSIYASNGRKFVFDLTVLRFEFLMRVAHGAMPTSFSKEIYSDFLSLKQKAIKTLDIKPNNQFIKKVDLDDVGGVQKAHIPLN